MNAEKRDEAERIPNLPSNTHPEKKIPNQSDCVKRERNGGLLLFGAPAKC